jgi:hypothetical protein
LLLLVGAAAIEHHTHPGARLDVRRSDAFVRANRRVLDDDHRIAIDQGHPPDRQPPMAREPTLDERLMIRAGEEAARDPARVGNVERGVVERNLRGDRCADRGAIVRDGRRDIGRTLEPPLDLQRRDADVGERLDRVAAREILRRQEIFDVAEITLALVHDELVGQATRLRTLPAVRAAAAPRFGRQALPRPCDAQRAVNEHLEGNRRALGVRADLVDRELAWDDDAREPELGEQRRGERRGRRHLRRTVGLERGAQRTRDQRDRGILHDDRVDAGGRDAPDQLLDDWQLRLEDERVERDVGLRAGAMDPGDDLGERVAREVRGTRAGVEAIVEAEVNGVGTGGEGGCHRIAIARRRQDLGAAHRGATLLGSVPYHDRSENPQSFLLLQRSRGLASRSTGPL